MRAQVVLLDGDRILLARHERPSGSYWVLPGGAIESEETPEEAARREVLEETGLDIEVDRLLFVEEPRTHDQLIVSHPRYTYLGRVVGGQLGCMPEPEAARGNKGHLADAAWMPFDSPCFDVPTRSTLMLVSEALK